MCGRATITKDMLSIIEDLTIDQWISKHYTPSYNIAPTQYSPILIGKNNSRYVQMLKWGLVPQWSKNLSIGSKMINARSETLLNKPSFKTLVDLNRCVVITDGYFEWANAQPHFIFHPEKKILPMAGLWASWVSSFSKKISTYTIITTSSQKAISHIHDRMPVILNTENIDEWIHCKNFNFSSVIQYLIPYKKNLSFYPVSTIVNSPKTNTKECIDPINDQSRTLDIF